MEEIPNPTHPAWQKICPVSGKTHLTCTTHDAPGGMTPDHLDWHMERLVEIGVFEAVGGADDKSQQHFRFKKE